MRVAVSPVTPLSVLRAVTGRAQLLVIATEMEFYPQKQNLWDLLLWCIPLVVIILPATAVNLTME